MIYGQSMLHRIKKTNNIKDTKDSILWLAIYQKYNTRNPAKIGSTIPVTKIKMFI
jgi:hypothetical protein